MTHDTHPARPAWQHGLLLATLAGTALFAAACGGVTGSPGPAGSGASSPSSSLGPASASPSGSGTVGAETGSPAASGDAASDPCSLVGASDAETLLKTSVSPASPVTTEVGSVCRYLPADGSTGFVVVTILGNAAGDAFERAVRDFSLAEVPGVGDTAAGVDGTIVVSSGKTLFSITATDAAFQPVPLDDLTQVAMAAVERLGNTNATPAPSASGEPSPTASP